MSTFQKYIHLERIGTDEVDGITVGTCHIFPKIDGTNAPVWLNENGVVCCGSRNRELTLDDDNAGFMAWATTQQHLYNLLLALPQGTRVYGEWLVPHSLKTYRADAWRNFYVFDVLLPDGSFMHYDSYSVACSAYGVEFVPCTSIAVNPTYESLVGATERNTYLLQDNSGVGEGIVIKQYGWVNQFERTTWAKLVTNVFKDKHAVAMGASVLASKMVEADIADEFITSHTVEKIMAKIRNEHGAFSAKNIPQLLNTAFHELVTEELWQAIKQHKNPRIDFKTLAHCSTARVKQLLPELFGLSQKGGAA